MKLWDSSWILCSFLLLDGIKQQPCHLWFNPTYCGRWYKEGIQVTFTTIFAEHWCTLAVCSHTLTIHSCSQPFLNVRNVSKELQEIETSSPPCWYVPKPLWSYCSMDCTLSTATWGHCFHYFISYLESLQFSIPSATSTTALTNGAYSRAMPNRWRWSHAFRTYGRITLLISHHLFELLLFLIF